MEIKPLQWDGKRYLKIAPLYECSRKMYIVKGYLHETLISCRRMSCDNDRIVVESCGATSSDKKFVRNHAVMGVMVYVGNGEIPPFHFAEPPLQ
jgi:hypothetical protein